MATGRIGTTPVLTTRWSKAPSAGTTSLSGLDDNSVSLVYSVGYEAVYQNGVLLSRGNDYTATNGTTITLTTATVAGDIIEVFANQTIPLTDTYSQTVANSLFVNQATFDAKGDLIAGTADNTYSRLAVGTNGQVLTAASTTSTGLTWATPATPNFVGVLCERTSGTISMTANVQVAVPFTSEIVDTNNFHDNSTNTTRFTIPSGYGGKYAINGFAFLDVGSSTRFTLHYWKNGSAPGGNQSVLQQVGNLAANNNALTGSRVVSLAAGDYVEFYIANDNTTTATVYAAFYLTYLGA